MCEFQAQPKNHIILKTYSGICKKGRKQLRENLSICLCLFKGGLKKVGRAIDSRFIGPWPCCRL